jgi:hypothetical protein
VERQYKNCGHRNLASGLRHRYVLLHLTSGILQCESPYKAKLSDFCGVVVASNDKDAHRMFIMVNQIPFGKTNTVEQFMTEQPAIVM